MRPRTFLTAEWRYLAMANYHVAPSLLQPYVPAGTELDSWNGKTFVSLVGFLFLKTRVLGIPIPFHRNFEEVNLRFYVKRRAGDEVRRGVVFIRELVPRWAIATTARLLYHETYSSVPMSHQICMDGLPKAPGVEPIATRGVPVSDGAPKVEYRWRFRGTANHLAVNPIGEPALAAPDSETEFVTEHYWGYAAQPDGGTMEYRVEHPRWLIYETNGMELGCDVAGLYGPEFVAPLAALPASSFLALGSKVTVRRGVRL